MEVMNVEEGTVEPVAMETAETVPEQQKTGDKEESKESPAHTDESRKKVYTEEERLKRKAYFKQLRDKRTRKRNNIGNPGNKRVTRGLSYRTGPRKNIISFDMTEEDDKVLNLYKVKLSALKSTNDQLHKRLAFLVKENMHLLQMGPPLKNI